jgi:hypothetical protein
MTTISLQKRLIKRISEIENVTVLQSIENLLAQEKSILLTPLQKSLIALSETDINSGNILEHSVAMKQISNKYGW